MVNKQQNVSLTPELKDNNLSNKVEPHFAIHNTKQLTHIKQLEWAEDSNSEALVEYLNFEILLNPSDLKAHVRKISILVDACDHQHLPQQGLNTKRLLAALADIFHILANHGDAIKYRMLLSARKHISDVHFDAFVQYIKGEFNDLQALLPHDLPRLFIDAPVLTTQGLGVQSSESKNQDLLAEINEYLENGLTDEAINKLEKVIHAQPQDVEISRLLTRLYRTTRNATRFNQTYQQLNQTTQSELPLCWRETNAFFSKSKAS